MAAISWNISNSECWLVSCQFLGCGDNGQVRYVIIFQYVQFWIRLAAVSYRGKKVRTVVSPVVRLVNKSRDTRNCVQNEPECAIGVLFATYLYYKALWMTLRALIWPIRHNYNRLDDGHCDVTGQRWARPVPWWQPMKFPFWNDCLRDQIV